MLQSAKTEYRYKSTTYITFTLETVSGWHHNRRNATVRFAVAENYNNHRSTNSVADTPAWT